MHPGPSPTLQFPCKEPHPLNMDRVPSPPAPLWFLRPLGLEKTPGEDPETTRLSLRGNRPRRLDHPGMKLVHLDGQRWVTKTRTPSLVRLRRLDGGRQGSRYIGTSHPLLQTVHGVTPPVVAEVQAHEVGTVDVGLGVVSVLIRNGPGPSSPPGPVGLPTRVPVAQEVSYGNPPGNENLPCTTPGQSTVCVCLCVCTRVKWTAPLPVLRRGGSGPTLASTRQPTRLGTRESTTRPPRGRRGAENGGLRPPGRK